MSLEFLEAEIEDVSGWQENSDEMGIVIELPEDCTSEENCPYICSSFIGFNGVQNEAQTLTTVSVEDINDVDAEPMVIEREMM